MKTSLAEVNRTLDLAAGLLNRTEPVKVSGPVYVGIDLGTADVVLMALNGDGKPVAAFLEWAEVVRDGIVLDFIGAVDIVKRLVEKAEKRLGRPVTMAATSFPPGTDPRLSANVLDSAGLDLAAIEDEPTCVASLLDLDKAAIIDIGGGTTGTAVVQNGSVVFSGDEPTGGRHISLVIAGHFGISFEEAEKRKRSPEPYGMLELAKPTLQRICDIVSAHIAGFPVESLLLTGGTCCLPGIDAVVADELNLTVKLPSQPLLLTPMAIASLARAGDSLRSAPNSTADL